MIKSDRAYAKINISLDIISKMSNGYHNMEMVMQTVSLYDTVTVECAPGSGYSVASKLSFLTGDERNTAVKAAMVFYERTGISGYKTSITLEKNIPVSAGLGGGSADGACVLRLLDDLHGTRLGSAVLEELGANVGSDVPFCVSGGTMAARGRGELLFPLSPLPPCKIVLCKPPLACSTSELFRHVRCGKIRARPDTQGIVAALVAGDLEGVARRAYNVFEDIMPRGVGEVCEIKSAMYDCGALGAAMSGTGPTVFGIFDDAERAGQAHGRLKEEFTECYIVEPVRMLTENRA